MSSETIWKYILVLIICQWVTTHAQVQCPRLRCTEVPALWLNTTGFGAQVLGSTLTIYPRQPNGELFSEAHASVTLQEVAEAKMVGGSCGGSLGPLEDWLAANRIARYHDVYNGCCDVLVEEEDIEELGVYRQSVVVNATAPRFPAFSIEIRASLFNASAQIIRPPSTNIGEGYIIELGPNSIKVDITVQNWPWRTDESPANYGLFGDTFLAFFLFSSSQLDYTGYMSMADTQTGKFMNFSAASAKAKVETQFIKVFTVNDTDYYTPLNRIHPDFQGTFEFKEPPYSIATPALLLACQGNSSILPRYSTITYDPSLGATFFPVTGNTPAGPNSKRGRHVNPAAYVVPIVVAVLIVVALVGVYVFVIRPKQVHYDNSHSLQVTNRRSDL